MRAAHQDYRPAISFGPHEQRPSANHGNRGFAERTDAATIAAFRVNSTECAENPDADFSAVIRRMEELAQVKVSDLQPVLMPH